MLHQSKNAEGRPGPATIIPFPVRPAQAGLSMRDRMEVSLWRSRVGGPDYDRMVIHERIACDAPEVDAFLGIYRQGEAWAHWNVARCGTSILVWCSVTGQDVGRFSSMREALLALFPAVSSDTHPHTSAEVIRAFC